jgi:osmotically-inducible protein OsmY
MILTRNSRRRGHIGRWTQRGVLLTTGLAAGALATRLDRHTMRRVAGKARGRAHSVTRRTGDIDDVTLTRKVESEIFRPADAPKSKVSVNVAHGVVELRGEVLPEQSRTLALAASRVDGVKDVRNLLHPPGTPARH